MCASCRFGSLLCPQSYKIKPIWKLEQQHRQMVNLDMIYLPLIISAALTNTSLNSSIVNTNFTTHAMCFKHNNRKIKTNFQRWTNCLMTNIALLCSKPERINWCEVIHPITHVTVNKPYEVSELCIHQVVNTWSDRWQIKRCFGAKLFKFADRYVTWIKKKALI